MTPKEKAFELYEAMRTHIGESDLHIPPWISEDSATLYPLEEKQVAKFCAIVAVNQIIKVAPVDKYENLQSELTPEELGLELFEEYWREVKTEIENL